MPGDPDEADLHLRVNFEEVGAGSLDRLIEGTLIHEGDLCAAAVLRDQTVILDPACAEAKMLDGQIAYLARDYARAKRNFDEVAATKSLPAELRSQALSARAVMEIAANMFDRARLTLWRAVRIDRRNAAAWYHLGHLSRDTYRFEDAALEQFEMAGRLMKDPARAKAIADYRRVQGRLRSLQDLSLLPDFSADVIRRLFL